MSPTEVRLVLTREVRKLGFVARNGSMMLELSPANKVFGWVGFNTALVRHSEQIELNMVIGVRNEVVEEVLADFGSAAQIAKGQPTIAGHIGYLTRSKSYRPTMIQRNGEIDVGEIIDKLRSIGIPFMERNVSLHVLSRNLRQPHFYRFAYSEHRVAAILYLLGNMRGLETLARDVKQRWKDCPQPDLVDILDLIGSLKKGRSKPLSASYRHPPVS